MKTTGAKILLKTLTQLKIKDVFLYPYKSLDVLANNRTKTSPRFVLAQKPENVVYMANGYARSSEDVGIAIVPPGAGAAQILPGLLTSYLDSIPIICISAQVPNNVLGTDAFQENNTIGVTQTSTKHNYLINKASDLPQILEDAKYLALSGRPGPVLIDIPIDILENEVNDEFGTYNQKFKGYKPVTTGHTGQIKKALNQILQAKRPLLYVGGGIVSSGGHELLREFAEALQIPVAQTLTGMGSLPSSHPLNLGLIGKNGQPFSNQAANSADVLVAIGTRFNPHVIGKTSNFEIPSYIIHIDIDPSVIAKYNHVDIPIVGDLKIVLQQFLEFVKDKKQALKPFHKTMKEWRDQIQTWENQLNSSLTKNEFSLKTLCHTLSKAAPKNTILTCAKQDLQIEVAKYFEFQKPKQWCPSAGVEAFGSALSSAIGVQIKNPKAQVCCLTTAHDLTMNLCELTTLVEEKLPIRIIMVSETKSASYKKPSLDLETLSKAYSVPYFFCDSEKSFASTLKKHLKTKKPFLIECEVKTS